MMTRRAVIVSGLKAAPLFGGLAALAGCGTGDSSAVPATPEDRNARVQDSMDYMRKQYESKQKRRK
jgi:hypothetical protein